MPGWELIGESEKEELLKIFSQSNGVLMAHGFNERRSHKFRVREFEDNVKKKFNSKHCLACTSGTMAQYIAMKSMGIGPGDEVITQSFTFVATVETIIALGASPIIVNIDETLNMDCHELSNAITKNTKLIVPVHMLGNQCRMDKIMQISNKHKIPVLEDACEAMGGKYDGKMLGTIADAGIFSLDFGKTITTGEGGLIVTNDHKLDKYAREFHDHGHENNKNFPRGKDTRTIPGLNLRMNEMQAAVGIAQLKKLDFILDNNRKHKKLLKSGINGNGKITFRTIVDEDGDLSDTLIFFFDDEILCSKFLKKYTELGYSTKNLPEAYDWHFAGRWNHMFKNIPRYKNVWQTEWQKSNNLLARSISIPILVNSTRDYILKHADEINKIIKSI